MAASAIKTWLEAKQRRAVRSAYFYFITTSLAGALALLLTVGIAFLFFEVALLLTLPTALHSNSIAWLLAGSFIVLLFVDCRRAQRDDMAVIPLWLAREYFHLGPRLVLDGWQHLADARKFSRISSDSCAAVLAYLVSKSIPTSREELMRILPYLSWEEIVPQLRCIEGVIVFRDVKKISLLAPLRLELRQWLAHVPGAEIPKEEPEAIPVDEPQQLSSHEILRVPANASAAEIKTAYRNRMKECHPDLFANMDSQSRALAEEWTKAINAAYVELLARQSR